MTVKLYNHLTDKEEIIKEVIYLIPEEPTAKGTYHNLMVDPHNKFIAPISVLYDTSLYSIKSVEND